MSNINIHITGGDDATNTTLIKWLQDNGALRKSKQKITFDLSTITDLTYGNHQVSVVAKGDNINYQDSYPSNELMYNVQPIPGYDFANDNWSVIAQQIKAGTDHYNLGDTKTDSITISGTRYDGTYNVTFKIVDNLVGRYTTQSGQSHKVIEIQEIFGTTSNDGVAWNSSGSGTSFANSSLKTDLNNTLINFLPNELKAVLETTTVYSSDGTQTASSSTNVGATCKLFVASFNEYYGSSATYGYANNTETNGKGQYTLYQQLGVTTSNYDDVKKYKIENTSSADWYWTRSPYGHHPLTGTALSVYTYGYHANGDVTSSSFRVAPCFAW